MKQNIASRLASGLLASLLFGNTLAQSPDQTIAGSFEPPHNPVTTLAANTHIGTGEPVNAKVLRSFERTFKGAQNSNWLAGTGKYVADFTMGDRKARALFDKDGHIIYTIYYGKDKDLPGSIKTMIQSKYNDYTITYVQEVIVEGSQAWLATLHNCSNIVKVRVMDNQLSELERFKRQ